ncbi:MAG: SDR family oxidoreductase, partial [Coriobacteriia bacterium]|nr:SDR family oxidoreductase [Coriobacteriia bacterium]
MTRNGRNTSSQLLEDKVVVVTGSTRGIGRSIADACSRAGAVVVVSSRKEDAVADTVDAFAANDQRVCGMSADVSSAEDVECLFETTLGLLGRIDAWVNNAGVSLGYRPLDECSSEEIDHIVSVNLTGTMLASRLLVPYFTEHGGILLNMSGRGHRGEATPFTAAYAATKSAVASITRSVAAENKGRPISVHALVPGMVDTDFYRDLEVSPRLEHARDNWRYAMEAFGVPLEEVGERAVPILAQVPGRQTGRIYSFLGPGRM